MYDAFFRNNEPLMATKRIVRRHSNVDRNGAIPSRTMIWQWVQPFRLTKNSTVRDAITRSPRRSAIQRWWRSRTIWRSPLNYSYHSYTCVLDNTKSLITFCKLFNNASHNIHSKQKTSSKFTSPQNYLW